MILAGDNPSGVVSLGGVARNPREPTGAGQGREDAPPVVVGPARERPNLLGPPHHALVVQSDTGCAVERDGQRRRGKLRPRGV
eukprot:12315471-Alexandrium_andersonii.AAC.1